MRNMCYKCINVFNNKVIIDWVKRRKKRAESNQWEVRIKSHKT